MSDTPAKDSPEPTLDAFRALIGQVFLRRNDAGPDVELRLETAEKQRRDPRATFVADRPFSLIFQGPLVPRLTQGMHDLDHAEHPLPDLFLVPVGEEHGGVQYEAVFS